MQRRPSYIYRARDRNRISLGFPETFSGQDFQDFSWDPPVHNRAQCSNHENGPINYKIGEEENLKPIKFPSIVLVTFLILIAFQEAVLRGAPSVTVHHKVHFIK